MARAPLGLPRDRRLRRAADFQAVARQGRKARDPLFLVTAAASSADTRLGLAVSRRVSTNAVVRNRIKRQIRESFRHHQAMLAGLDIVVVAHAAAATASNAELASALQQHWERLVPRCGTS